MERKLVFNKNLCFVLLGMALAIAANAQSDTTYLLQRNGMDARFAFKKAMNATQYRNPGMTFPQYSMDSRQFHRIMTLLEHFVAIEADYERLKEIKVKQDSLIVMRESAMHEALKNQGLRADNFQSGYNRLLYMNEQLELTLQKCETTALRTHRSSKRRLVISGLVAGAMGFLLGAAAL